MRQQAIDSGVVLGFVRALVIGGFMQHEVGVFLVVPGFTVDGEIQVLGIELGKRVITFLAVYRDFAMPDHDAASLARAKPLGMQSALKLQYYLRS
jgi:hypothetical protein